MLEQSQIISTIHNLLINFKRADKVPESNPTRVRKNNLEYRIPVFQDGYRKGRSCRRITVGVKGNALDFEESSCT